MCSESLLSSPLLCNTGETNDLALVSMAHCVKAAWNGLIEWCARSSKKRGKMTSYVVFCSLRPTTEFPALVKFCSKCHTEFSTHSCVLTHRLLHSKSRREDNSDGRVSGPLCSQPWNRPDELRIQRQTRYARSRLIQDIVILSV